MIALVNSNLELGFNLHVILLSLIEYDLSFDSQTCTMKVPFFNYVVYMHNFSLNYIFKREEELCF